MKETAAVVEGEETATGRAGVNRQSTPMRLYVVFLVMRDVHGDLFYEFPCYLRI